MLAIKKSLLFICLILITQSLTAQIHSVLTNIYGKVLVAIEVDCGSCVIIDTCGNILDIIEMDRLTEYYSSFNDYEAGRVKTMAGVKFTYYSDFNDYEAGKVKRIGEVEFSYYSNFNDYETGKLKSIGNHQYTYFSKFDGDHTVGRLKSGNRRFTIKGITFVMRLITNSHSKLLYEKQPHRQQP